jgi:hypothetical protein
VLFHLDRIEIDKTYANAKVIFNLIDQMDEAQRIHRMKLISAIELYAKPAVQCFQLLIYICLFQPLSRGLLTVTMNVIRTETLSPAWFEAQWRIGVENLLAWLGGMIERMPLMAVVPTFLIAAAWVSLLHFFSPHFSTHLADKIWAAAEPAFFLALCLGLLQLYFPQLQKSQSRATFALVVFAITVLHAWWRAQLNGQADIISGSILTWVTFPLLLISLQVAGLMSRRTLILALCSLFAIFPAFFAYVMNTDSIISTPEWYLVWTDRLIIPFSVALAEVWQQGGAWTAMFNRERLSQLFHPAYFFTMLPLAEGELHHSKSHRILFVSAFFLFFEVVLFKTLNMPLEKFLLTSLPPQPKWQFETLAYGWLTYLDFFLFSFAGTNLGIVLGRWLGWNLGDATDFSLLATSPLERWRRWNTYFYGWLFRFVFVPVYRRRANMFLSIQLVFLVTALLHVSRLIVTCFLLGLPAIPTQIALAHFAFFQIHGLVVYGTYYFPGWMQNAHSRKGWYGVVSTHLIMAAVHIIPLRFFI